MYIYIFVFMAIIGLYIPLKKYSNGKILYCIIICSILTLIVGLRNISMGLTDTQYVYYPRFNEISRRSFDYIYTLKDYGFQIITYFFIKIFGTNFKLYTLAFAFPYIGAVSFLIYKYSSRPWLSYILFVCLPYYEISFTLMRQVMGMAFLCIAMHYYLQEKKSLFVVFVLIASTFHQICLIFLIMLLIKYLKPKKWMVIILLFIVGLCLLYPQYLLGIVYKHIHSDRFIRYSVVGKSKNLTFFFINLSLFAVNFLSFNKIKSDRCLMILFINSCICLAISPLTMALGEMSRIAYIFGIYNILLVPEFVNKFKVGYSRLVVCVGFVAIFVSYFLVFLGPQVNVIPYFF